MVGNVACRLWLATLGLALACAANSQALRAEEGGCSKVTAEALGVSGLTLLGSKWQEAAEGSPRHCILQGKVNERVGVDGHAYAIQFELRLPETWNGRFLHQADEGFEPPEGDAPAAFILGEGGRKPHVERRAEPDARDQHAPADVPQELPTCAHRLRPFP